MKQIKQDAKYAMVVPSSMGVRICPPSGQPVQSSDLFIMQATSAETNVLSISSYLGKRTKVLTAFVKGSPIADYIKRDLRSRRMNTTTEVPQAVPGLPSSCQRADSGYGSRGPRVWNDRSGEVGRTLDASNYDLHKLFAEDGVGILHISGLIAALSEQTTKFCLELARTAHKYGTVVSFDLNYRASFWLNREEELRASFTEIASSPTFYRQRRRFPACPRSQRPGSRRKGYRSDRNFQGDDHRRKGGVPECIGIRKHPAPGRRC